jgi:hypothetical protein
MTSGHPAAHVYFRVAFRAEVWAHLSRRTFREEAGVPDDASKDDRQVRSSMSKGQLVCALRNR